MLAALVGGPSLYLQHQGSAGNATAWLSMGEGLPLHILRVAFWLGAVLIVLGVIWMGVTAYDVRRLTSRSTVIVVELRGLVDTSDVPLSASVPRRLPGVRQSVLLDLRPELRASALEAAIQELGRLPDAIRMMRVDRPRELTRVVVGGVVQVPFLFAAGVMLDDEGAVVTMDWDRQRGRWRELDEQDDGERFIPTGLDAVPENSPRVVVAVSASYSVDSGAITDTFPNIPLVSLRLKYPRPNTLWSAEKQDALAQQFLDLMAALTNCGVVAVDLILAAPSSLAIRMGRAHDPRNLPRVRCYQYQKDQSPPYPWSVEIALAQPLRLLFSRPPQA